jgi:hypothetical protein
LLVLIVLRHLAAVLGQVREMVTVLLEQPIEVVVVGPEEQIREVTVVLV